jgi:hypothetical protein
MTNKNRVNVFFYGGYMNFDILASFGISEREYHVVQLPGYQLTIGSTANLVRSGLERVFGIVTQLTHDELETLYGVEAQAKLGAQYMPEPVLVITSEGDILPSLCYIAYDLVAGVPSAAYIDTILSAARAYNLPQSYVQHVESFKGDFGSSEA